MVARLSEATGTIYLTDDYAVFVKYFLNLCVKTVKEGPVPDESFRREYAALANTFSGEKIAVIDIAGTRFTKPVWREMRTALENNYQVLQLIDSEDKTRHEFLKDFYLTLLAQDICMERVGQPELPSEELPLLPTRWEFLPKWLDELRTDIVYRTIRYQDNPEVQSLILIMRPNVKIWAYNRTVFRYLADKCVDIMDDETDFLYILSDTDEYWKAHVDENGMVAIPNMNPMPKADFLKKYLCIPDMFGSMYMEQADPRLKPAFQSIFRDVKALINKQDTTIASYYREALNEH